MQLYYSSRCLEIAVQMCRQLICTNLEADFHGCLCNGKVCSPHIVQRDLLLCNGSKQLLHPILKAYGVDIQCPVEEVDAFLSQTRKQQHRSVNLVVTEALHDDGNVGTCPVLTEASGDPSEMSLTVI